MIQFDAYSIRLIGRNQSEDGNKQLNKVEQTKGNQVWIGGPSEHKECKIALRDRKPAKGRVQCAKTDYTSIATRQEVILAATSLYCSICNATPCYLLSTTAISVLNEQLTENDCCNTTNLIGAVRYSDSLEKVQGCLVRHIEVTREAWQLDNHFRVSEETLRELERQGKEVKHLRASLQKEALNGEPPKHN